MSVVMTLGPSRRPTSRLSLIQNTSPLSSVKSDEENRFPGTPTSKGSRRSGTDQSIYNRVAKLKLLLRRVPLSVWFISIAMYCCIMYLRMDAHQLPIQNKNDDSLRRHLNNSPTSERSQTTITEHETIPVEKFDIKPEPLRAAGTDRKQQLDKIVHVVETRFMQKQSRLLELGFARLALFEAFCLPSMLAQTNKDFVWIIRADPELHPSIVFRLQQLLEGRDNFILIGSNDNPEGYGRPKIPFESFLRKDNNATTVWSGNISLAEEAYDLSADGAVLLETRLDSDDGIHINFIQMVQEEARKNLLIDNSNQTSDHWRLWCIESRIEWHPLSPFPETPEILAANETSPNGYLVYYSEKGCSTPGLTFGYGAEASRDSLGFDHLRHDEIAAKIAKCNKHSDGPEVKCVSRLSDLKPGAIRARTTTSAGMANVITGNEELDKKNPLKRLSKKEYIQQYFEQQKLWNGAKHLLKISSHSVQFARSIIVERMQEIAADNLSGQCTAGHSCKKGTKKMLESLAQASEPKESLAEASEP